MNAWIPPIKIENPCQAIAGTIAPKKPKILDVAKPAIKPNNTSPHRYYRKDVDRVSTYLRILL